ncbi:MAG TPA: M20 family metallopeptidase [Geopsychrobacteraceae bacterium]|jgi:amidohydrolase
MLAKARNIAAEIVAIRRQLHRFPELGYQEEKTSELIRGHLDRLGIACRTGIARTGVVAELARGPGKTVALRADIDALPITEQTGLPFASEHPGLMHACGHDAHTAMLLGAARLLRDESFSGTIRLLFQPSEENNLGDPDGYSGAKRMLVEGALQGVDYALALHQLPMLPTGSISLREGPVLAAADRFEIVVHGRSAHAGVNPEQGVDAIVIAAELVGLLQTIVSRNVAAGDQAVVSIGSIAGGSSYNIVADKVVLSGTTRALDNQVYRNNLSRIRTICTHLAQMHETAIDFNLQHAVPVTVNSELVTAQVRTSAEKIFTRAGILSIPPMLGGEDFSYIAAEIPSCFALLGTQPPQGQPTSLHHPLMLIDEEALPLGSAFLAQAALDLLAG